jgi:hypothetical protein
MNQYANLILRVSKLYAYLSFDSSEQLFSQKKWPDHNLGHQVPKQAIHYCSYAINTVNLTSVE